jgi:hypothetical protein
MSGPKGATSRAWFVKVYEAGYGTDGCAYMETMPFLPPGQHALLSKRQLITYYPHLRASLNLVLHVVGRHRTEYAG